MNAQVSLSDSVIPTKGGSHPAERRMPAEEWDSIKSVLVVRLDNMGDVVLLSPAIRALKARAPEASVTLLASPSGSTIAPLVPGVDSVLSYRAEWQSVEGTVLDPRRTVHLATALSSKRFDAALIFTSFSQSPYPPAMACYLAGIPRRIGQSKEFGGDILTHWVTPPSDGVHQADRNLYLLETAGVPSLGHRLALRVPESARQAVDELLRSRGLDRGRLVVAVPGASCAARRYDPERLADAMSMLASSTDVSIAIAGHEREEWMGRIATERSNRVVSLAGLTATPEFVALIERADVVIAANSAALHVADALDRPVLVTYSGAEETEQWRPRTAPSVLLSRFTECAPCHLFDCPVHMRCLDIEPAEVAERAQRLLQFSNRASRARAAAREALGVPQ